MHLVSRTHWAEMLARMLACCCLHLFIVTHSVSLAIIFLRNAKGPVLARMLARCFLHFLFLRIASHSQQFLYEVLRDLLTFWDYVGGRSLNYTVRNAVPSLLPRADRRLRFGEYSTFSSQSEWRWVRRDLLLLKAKKAECNIVRAQRLQVVMIFFSPVECLVL